ncbi:amidohydrolase [Synergistales bacterium]|nr:amidohydrolase [Synergistales bacterium]
MCNVKNKIALVNGRIHTPFGIREALLIEAGRVASVGKGFDVLSNEDKSSVNIIDLKERPVFPGFSDSHAHFVTWAESMELIDMRDCMSIEEMKTVLRKYISGKTLPEGEWIRGRNWNNEQMVGARMPNRRDLDEIAPANPVVLTRVCGHIAVLNTAALNLVGVTRDTRVEAGLVELDEDGEPTGVLGERALALAYGKIERPSDADMLSLFEKYAPLAASYGLTHINSEDMGVFDRDFRRLINFYRTAEREGKLPFRVTAQISLPHMDALLDFLSEGHRTGDGTPFFQIGPLKLICDGSLGARTAFLREPYADAPDTLGMQTYTQEALNDLVRVAHTSGMQIAAHAIGDGALEMCLDAFEAARDADMGAARHFIVHAQAADDKQLERMKNLHIGAAIQPSFVLTDKNMALSHLGVERAARSYRWKTMLKKGLNIAGGSDAPIETLRPLWGIHAAVTRSAQNDKTSEGWMPEEKLSVAEAIYIYTQACAWQGHAERRRGEIAPGRFADLVVLEQDPFLVSPSEIWKIGVDMTLCGGRITHQSDNLRDNLPTSLSDNCDN